MPFNTLIRNVAFSPKRLQYCLSIVCTVYELLLVHAYIYIFPFSYFAAVEGKMQTMSRQSSL